MNDGERFFGLLFARIAYEQAQSMVVARDVAERNHRASMVQHCQVFFDHWSDVWARCLDVVDPSGIGILIDSTSWGDA